MRVDLGIQDLSCMKVLIVCVWQLTLEGEEKRKGKKKEQERKIETYCSFKKKKQQNNNNKAATPVLVFMERTCRNMTPHSLLIAPTPCTMTANADHSSPKSLSLLITPWIRTYMDVLLVNMKSTAVIKKSRGAASPCRTF